MCEVSSDNESHNIHHRETNKIMLFIMIFSNHVDWLMLLIMPEMEDNNYSYSFYNVGLEKMFDKRDEI